jgi:hypothetical protein
MKIFVSHASDDQGKRTAVRFKELLREGSEHAQVFLSSDWDSIPSGALWVQAVEEALSSCDYFIALITRKDDAEKLWVNYEVDLLADVAFCLRSLFSAGSSLRKLSIRSKVFTCLATVTQTAGFWSLHRLD